jgi:hypothetical protein
MTAMYVASIAGDKLELFYNPDLTPLRGPPDIYVRGSFNRCVFQFTLCCLICYIVSPGICCRCRRCSGVL